MTTARDLIQGAFEACRVYAPGEFALDADLARGFGLLNQMMDSWSNESLTCFAILEQAVPLEVNKTAYTIGPTSVADIVSARPIRLVEGPGTAYLLDSNSNRYPVDTVPKDKWNEIWNITAVNSNLPDTLYYDPQFPLGIINLYPAPNQSGITLYFDSYQQLTAFPSVDGTVSLPPGYEQAIQTNLAIQFEPYFPTAVLTAALVKAAADGKGNVKRSNVRENIAEFEKVLSARGGAVWNIYSDSYR